MEKEKAEGYKEVRGLLSECSFDRSWATQDNHQEKRTETHNYHCQRVWSQDEGIGRFIPPIMSSSSDDEVRVNEVTGWMLKEKRSDVQRQLYKALIDAYEVDNILLDTYGDTVTIKRPRDGADVMDSRTLRMESDSGVQKKKQAEDQFKKMRSLHRTYSAPEVIYENKDKMKQIPEFGQFDELHKFSGCSDKAPMKKSYDFQALTKDYRTEHAEYDESNTYVLERFNTTAGNPVKKILLKLNLSDHRLFKDGGGDFRYSDTTHLSQSVEVLKLKNFKKDATLKLSKSTNQERYEHVGPEVASSQDGKVSRWRRDCAWLMISRCSRSQCQIQVQGTSSILKSMITTTYSQEKVKSKS
ncbi:hypothetical protein Tco_0386193 [Tanacetum coccineum]